MAFSTITTTRDDTCRRCEQPIPAGTRVRWARRAGTYHLSAECPGGEAGASDGSSSAPTRRARTVRSSWGFTRCTHEDYPCCGCER